ncbi:MAG: DUF2807 domain-containing protein [Chitinophagaceae bacterium]|nr:DUF2807 domain-containing protein [Chitinophagaceae bacterium]
MKKSMYQFLFGSSLNDNRILNLGWLLFRLHLGISIAIHAGWPKMNTLAAPGWFNDQVAGLGFTFPSPAFWATLASWGEFVGGIGIALGLLTRFNALQLVFQFFVIAFLWYDNPEPLSGMYFQNTLFMGFLLVLFAGGGRYSLDQWIVNRKKISSRPMIKTAVAVILVMGSLNVTAQNKPLKGSGVLLSQTFNYDNFEKINIRDLHGKIKVELGKPFSVSVTIDDNLNSLLRVSNNNEELKMELEGNENNRMYIEATNINIKISMPALTVLKHFANSDISVVGISGRSIQIKGGGNGDIILQGNVEEMDIEKSGNGDLKAGELLANKVRVQKSGNGDVLINSPNAFVANGSGNGDVVNHNEGRPASGSGIDGNGEIRYKNQPTAPAMPDSKRVQVRINNKTGHWMELVVKYPGKGSYGIDLKAYGSVKETVPVGTRFYQEGRTDQPVYEVTAGEKQNFSITK